MWITSFLPDAAIHLILVVGVIGTIAGFALGMIPLINAYKLPIQIISVLILSFGLYAEGGLANDANWKIKVLELEARIASAETDRGNVNTSVVTKVITKRQIVKEKGDDIIRYIDREIIKYDSTCPLPESVIKAHNAAALNKAVDVILTPTTTIDTSAHNAAASTPSKLPVK